ncbi:hypothetical protein LTR08_008357 [Meristemomyces frigidus]|nr:hypothetical protein LTR08_008357 [Meristemomyces frigidus]
MSSETINPIDPARFALALESLPLDALHAKAAEILHSINHLRSSNEQMLPFAEQGDADCRDAMFENLAVIGRMNGRVGLVRAEVERRGQRWSEGEVEDGVDGIKGDGLANGIMVNGIAAAGDEGTSLVNSTSSGEAPTPRAPSGRLTDEELRAQMAARLGGGDEEEEDNGVHL